MSNPEQITFTKPLLGFAAYSGTGKTTLLQKLIPELKSRGLRVAVIKHAHHNFDVDKPGKDSYELRKAGAAPMLIASSRRTVIMIDNEVEQEPDLEQLLSHIPPDSIDLVLVEGFKQWPLAKIELNREATGKSFMFPEDHHVIAIAHDYVANDALSNTELPQLDINNVQEIADFIIQFKQQATSIED